MDFVFTFLEGIASFISPCLLPMLPIYISYFAGEDINDMKRKYLNAFAFVLGFTTLFLLLSISASTFGSLVSKYMRYIKIAFGVIIILLGINYIGLLNLKFLNKSNAVKADTKNLTFFKSLMFGILFSISWTPCIGTFLSSALLLIAKHQDVVKGIFLMLTYSLALGIPFLLSVFFMELLKDTFNFIKKNYDVIKKISGIILIVMGLYIIFF